MDDSTAQLVKNALGTFVRWVLILASGLLIKKGVISTEQSEVYVQQVTPVVIGALMALVTLGWGIWQKKHQVDKVQTALDLPAGTSLKTLNEKV